MVEEPAARMIQDHVQRAGLLEKMASALNNHEVAVATDLHLRAKVETDHRPVKAADQQKGRRRAGPQRLPGKVGSPATSDDRDDSRILGGSDQRRSGSGAGAKVADRESRQLRILRNPVFRHAKASSEQRNIEDID